MRRQGLSFRLFLTLFLLALPAWSAAAPIGATATAHDDSSIQKPEKPKISPQEAKELFEHLDAVLQFVSDDTKYPIVHAVKRELASRDNVQKNIENNLKNDQDAQRLERSGMVLQKFGLIPHGFDLHGYMVKLLREQVAGYYSLPDKTVYMMNWVSEQEQMPIMAHELTHALQDQQVDLTKWLRGDENQKPSASGQLQGGNAKPAQLASVSQKSQALPPETADEKEIRQDEEQAARQALVEGQGMVVMVDYLLRDTGQNFLNAPFVVQSLRAAMTEGSNYPVYKNAPLYLRESLSFPYYYGMDFIEALLLKGGKRMAYAEALKNPPEDTRQIMQ